MKCLMSGGFKPWPIGGVFNSNDLACHCYAALPRNPKYCSAIYICIHNTAVNKILNPQSA